MKRQVLIYGDVPPIVSGSYPFILGSMIFLSVETRRLETSASRKVSAPSATLLWKIEEILGLGSRTNGITKGVRELKDAMLKHMERSVLNLSRPRTQVNALKHGLLSSLKGKLRRTT